MNNNQLAEVAKILGVSEDIITAMYDEDKKAVFEALDNLWQKGSVYIELAEVAKSTGITLATLRSLDYETQQSIVYEFMMDRPQTASLPSVPNFPVRRGPVRPRTFSESYISVSSERKWEVQTADSELAERPEFPRPGGPVRPRTFSESHISVSSERKWEVQTADSELAERPELPRPGGPIGERHG
ncbi:hypothetical protein [uncultured Ruminococcus sp.]|uniref:hypothetical protein n=1 Tax=uncultured Ruminococcus sp. TaxID=165186 RepID=UPI0025CD8A29|nr:hypothetical protein [uncultured Ruminococcus sp.]